MVDATPKLELPYLVGSQADKHVSVNAALSTLDTIVQLCVKSQAIEPPATPRVDGEVFIVGPGTPTADWAGIAIGTIVRFENDGWTQIIPRVGWLAYLENEAQYLVWVGSQWQQLSAIVDDGGSDNLWINSEFEVWQRGIVHTLGPNQSKLTADRWRCKVGPDGTAVVSKIDLPQQAGAPLWVRSGLRFEQTQASSAGSLIEQRIEDVTTYHAGVVTISFYARASVPISIQPKVTQHFGNSESPPQSSDALPIQINTAWARHSVQVPISALGNAVIGTDSFLSVGLKGPDNQVFWLEITLPTCQVGLTSKLPKKPSPGQTLRQCQRYYCKTFPLATAPASNTQDIGGPFESAYSSVAYGNLMSWQFPTTMRKLPVIETYNPYSPALKGMAIAGGGNYDTDIYSLTEAGVLLRNTQQLGFAPTPVNLHVTAEAEL